MSRRSATLARRLAPVAVALALAARPGVAQTGLVPISDLGSGTYAGFPGGLYPGGVNTPPAAHRADALSRAAGIVPRNAAGAPDPEGWIGMIAVGMSNTTHEFGAFERNADTDTSRNARVVIIDTGFGGQTATAIADPAAPYWTTMSQRIAAMGLTAAQVQVAWLKEAEAQPPNNFPGHALALRDTLKHVVRNLHDKFPNLTLCYLSSRIYGGYAAPGSLNPEPQAYESGFSVKWLIEDQIDGDPLLNYGQVTGDVRAPLLLWGPYLWADGPSPRSDGLVWLPPDLESDHTHPSASGEQKVATMLAAFFAGDTTAAAWWRAQPGTRLVALDAIHDATVSAAAPSTNYGADPLLVAQGGATPRNIYLRFDASGETRPIRLAKLNLRVDTNGTGGGTARLVGDATWTESTITYAGAPAIGPALVNMPQATRDGTVDANVTGAVLADADRALSFAVTTNSAGAATYPSKEGGQPPRLVLVVSTGAPTGVDGSPSATRLIVSPNPSWARTRVAFELARAGAVDLAVLSVDGRRVRTLARGVWSAGTHELWWDGRTGSGREAPAGIYWVCLDAGSTRRVGTLVRIR